MGQMMGGQGGMPGAPAGPGGPGGPPPDMASLLQVAILYYKLAVTSRDILY